MNRTDRPIIIWLFIGVFMIAAMVIIGGITRLTESGLSMVEWRLLAGTFPPLTEIEWIRVFNEYKLSPQFKELNNDFLLSDFQQIFWWEYIHRLWGRLIGLVFAVPFLVFLVQKRFNATTLKKLIVILVLGGFQGFLGWYMVSSGLINEPRVSHYRLAAHLTTAFLTFALTLWLSLDLIFRNQKAQSQIASASKWFVGFFILYAFQLIYGAFVAGMDAGTMHNHFPLMENGALIAESVFVLDPVYLNFIDGKSGIQFVHRYLAYAVFLMVFTIWYKFRKQVNEVQKLGLNLMLLSVSLQFLLGVFTLVYSVPLVLGVLHQVGALLLLAAALFSYHRLTK